MIFAGALFAEARNVRTKNEAILQLATFDGWHNISTSLCQTVVKHIGGGILLVQVTLFLDPAVV